MWERVFYALTLLAFVGLSCVVLAWGERRDRRKLDRRVFMARPYRESYERRYGVKP